MPSTSTHIISVNTLMSPTFM